MKVKRQKTNRRHMNVYTHSYGFREPFQVLVDGNFVAVALHMKTDLNEALGRVLTGPARAMTTACVQAELRTLGRDFYAALESARSLERRRCTHPPHAPVAAAQCIAEIIGETNKHNYCVATQDLPLRSKLRKIPGTPLIYINKSVVILEPPSLATTEWVKEMEKKKTLPQAFEVSVINKPAEPEPEPPKRKKKAKGPNPLSVKKKTKEEKQADAAKSAAKAKSKVGDGKAGSKRVAGSEEKAKGGEAGGEVDGIDGTDPGAKAVTEKDSTTDATPVVGTKRSRDAEESEAASAKPRDAQAENSFESVPRKKRKHKHKPRALRRAEGSATAGVAELAA
ncbi:Fcf1-domain-containing protein [Fimicolochytrium jonesii]|uniref:Fcf1-domain-containing protein n=1 Tax=Fimicolochytrium jonesii TaxID=1396493 RepID=UPI0022FED27A|nr:Fcf1-domain-containing protein [Fimicolochytrium jonesii]KAI8823059.1 Fcf1-domain-containing protein [Fimicolochytrium jonesii]